MNRKLRHQIISQQFLLCIFVLLYSPNVYSSGIKQRPIYSVERSDANELILTFTPRSYHERVVEIEGKKFTVFESDLSGTTQESGKPLLPIEGTLIALPPGTIPTLEILESQFSPVEQQNIAPSPSYHYAENGEATADYTIDRTFYQTAQQFYPASLAEFGETSILRHLQVVKLVVHPIQYLPALQRLRKLTHLKIRIKFIPLLVKSSVTWKPILGPDPLFEPLMKNLVVNYQQSSQWKGHTVHLTSGTPVDSTATWFTPGKTYVRIPVINDGMVRLTYNDFLSLGIDLTTLNIASTALYFKGASEPLIVQTSDTIPQSWYVEFYAQRNHGVNSYYNRFDDTSSYWMTWDDAQPRRYTLSTTTPSAPTDTVRWYTAISHQEQDNNYFFGVTEDEIQTTNDVPGEGWYWNDFVTGTTRSFSFTIDTVQRQTGTPVQLKARLHGMTLCQSVSCQAPSRHSAQLKLNGILIGTIDWTDNTEAIFINSFADSLLRTGSNSLQVISKLWTPADSNISKFYLDWFDVSYPKPLTVQNNSLKFSINSLPSTGTASFVVTGLSSDSATVINLTDGVIVNGVQPISAQDFIVNDTITHSKEYVIVNTNGRLTPQNLQSKIFSNIRSNSAGADYIIITHNQFLTEATQLAQHRATTNGLRTSVVTVQDIYDEFNYGHLDPEAMRSFLKYAYNNWTQPAPSYVLLLGDACWDFKRNLAGTIKQNFVPSYGNPPSDNAFVSFDSVQNYLPNMYIGRIPAENAVQASQVVSKVIGYDSPSIAKWNKSYLFITGGDTPSEKSTFNFWSDDLINRYVISPPFGGTAYKVYKSTDAIIDGDQKPYMQNLIKDGLVFVNFIGHSGGRIWGVDIGDPNQLQNTDGKLPFISSVSCNAGFFSDPKTNVLAENFLMADNRGGIATWAGSSIGYGSVGRALVDKFLSSAAQDSQRTLGLLTTVARLYYWQINPLSQLSIQTLQLHPLLGDPYTTLAIPLKPDFDVAANDVALGTESPTADSTVILNAAVNNWGLTAGKQILVSLKDSYTNELGQFKGESDIVPPFIIPDILLRDSFSIPWNVKGQAGSHTVTVHIDPQDTIAEVRKDNNTAQQTFYIFRNTISIVKPPPSSVVGSSPELVVTVPAGRDTTPLNYTFEVDTAADFTSAAKIISPAILPGTVSASWQTPALSPNRTYYWRSRTSDGVKYGAWVSSSFSLEPGGQVSDTAHWIQQTAAQFQTNTIHSLSANDTGMRLVLLDSTRLYARSVGSRYNQTSEFYSILKINSVVANGYWWQNSYSFIGASYNPTDGSYRIKGFDLLIPGYTDTMLTFLTSVPAGNYVMLTVVLNGKQNVTEAIYQQIEQLGSTKIRSVLSGQSWLMIARKGDGVAIAEDYQPTGISEKEFIVGNVYHQSSGDVQSQSIGPASKWLYTSWNMTLPNGNTSATVRVLGIKKDQSIDTLMTSNAGSALLDLSSVNPIIYPKISLRAVLSNNDGQSTPVLKQWNVDYITPPDLAISAWTVHAAKESVKTGTILPVYLDVHNIGYQRADSVTVSVFTEEDTTNRIDVLIDSIGINQHNFLTANLPIYGSIGTRTLTVRLQANAHSNDWLLENNVARLPIIVVDSTVGVEQILVLFDGKEIRNGDYVQSTPAITITLPAGQTVQGIDLSTLPIFVDGQKLNPSITGANGRQELSIHQSFSDGEHRLDVLAPNNSHLVLAQTSFRVAGTAQILQTFNYPNPFASQTMFTFILTGSQQPEEVRIKIYTVAGRVVRELVAPQSQLQIGFNQIPWDGNDTEGDVLANGNYFYRVSMKTGGQTASVIQRLTKIR